MSRKLKYGEPTKTVGFKVPLSKEKEVIKIVKDYLNHSIISKWIKYEIPPPQSFNNGDAKRTNDFIIDKIDATIQELENAKSIDYIWSCGCVIIDGLLKRSQNSKCKLTKSEH